MEEKTVVQVVPFIDERGGGPPLLPSNYEHKVKLVVIIINLN